MAHSGSGLRLPPGPLEWARAKIVGAPGPLEWARAEIGGADQWALKRREFLGDTTVNYVTSTSLGYLLSFFNKNSTLKGCLTCHPAAIADESRREYDLREGVSDHLMCARRDNFDKTSLD